MKTLSLCYIFSGGKAFTFSLPKKYMLFMLMTAFALFIWTFCASAHASSLPKNLSLIHSHANGFRPELIERKALFQALQKDVRKPQIDYLAKQTNLVLNNTLKGLAKSAKINITPQVVMKPFFLVQEVKNALYLFQARHLKKQIQIDRNFQAKILYNAKELSFMQEMKKKKPLLFSPYKHRTYGIHVQINFK